MDIPNDDLKANPNPMCSTAGHDMKMVSETWLPDYLDNPSARFKI